MKNVAPSKNSQRLVRHRRIRARIIGTAARPRLAVFKSNTFVSAQLIDDAKGTTLAQAHGREYKGAQSAQAVAVGKAIGERALALGVKTAVFDRGGYAYGGQIKALADAARAAGLTF